MIEFNVLVLNAHAAEDGPDALKRERQCPGRPPGSPGSLWCRGQRREGKWLYVFNGLMKCINGNY